MEKEFLTNLVFLFFYYNLHKYIDYIFIIIIGLLKWAKVKKGFYVNWVMLDWSMKFKIKMQSFAKILICTQLAIFLKVPF